MKFSDYLACISCADMISGGIVHGNIILGLGGIFFYFIWENFRVWEEKNTP